MEVQSVFKCNHASIILQGSLDTNWERFYVDFEYAELSLFGSEIKLASPINNP